MNYGCFPREEAAFCVHASALGVFLSTVFSSYTFQGSPLAELGEFSERQIQSLQRQKEMLHKFFVSCFFLTISPFPF